jgi:hypothetical protein
MIQIEVLALELILLLSNYSVSMPSKTLKTEVVLQ